MNVSFDALPAGAMALDGAVRFYAKELRPAFKLYASPVNMAASNPPQPVSTPDDFASDLQGVLGEEFYTQGMPEETNALRDGTFTDDDYEKQVQHNATIVVQADKVGFERDKSAGVLPKDVGMAYRDPRDQEIMVCMLPLCDAIVCCYCVLLLCVAINMMLGIVWNVCCCFF